MFIPQFRSAFSTKIYTRTGDKGTTFLNTETGRLPKYSLIFHVLGDTDELSSSLSVTREHVKCKSISDRLVDIQHRLQDINSLLSSRSDQPFPYRHNLLAHKTSDLETEIDSLTSHLDPLRNFIIPSGGPAASHLHFSRAICRRAERSLCLYLQSAPDKAFTLSSTEIYLNRLSDYLFTAARYCAKMDGCTETIYSSRSTK